MRYLKPDTTKLDRARRVLKAMRIPWAKGRWSGVDAFNNCREQGYTLTVSNPDTGYRWFTFSEYRNTDAIVVYSGTGWPPSTGVDEASYATKRFFENEQLAADFISAEASK